MPRDCTVCTSPDLSRIDAALGSGCSYRSIAGRFGTSKSALERHRSQGHTDLVVRPNATAGDAALVEKTSVGDPAPDVSGQPDDSGGLLAKVMVDNDSADGITDPAHSVGIAPGDTTTRVTIPQYPCPDCGSEMEPPTGSVNVHKLGTAWCPTHGRRPLGVAGREAETYAVLMARALILDAMLRAITPAVDAAGRDLGRWVRDARSAGRLAAREEPDVMLAGRAAIEDAEAAIRRLLGSVVE
jgi:hypothetical protein